MGPDRRLFAGWLSACPCLSGAQIIQFGVATVIYRRWVTSAMSSSSCARLLT